MPEKLFTIKELSVYLNMPETTIYELVEEGVIPAYKIGGSFLRFRKEQIDAIKHEISAKLPHLEISSDITPGVIQKQETTNLGESFSDLIIDFFYFNDFYIISFAIVIVLLYIIFKM